MYFLLAFTSGLGAVLLFLVQPFMAKSLLPLLGGAPLTWNGTMVFFQMALLVGYLYAHFFVRWLNSKYISPRNILLIHSIFLAVVVYFATDVSGQFDVATANMNQPLFWLWGVLLKHVGLVFVLIAATAPLTQAIAALSLPNRNPYALYVASNVGSMVGLFVYPLFLEPWFDLSLHGQVFCVGVFALIVCWLLMWHGSGSLNTDACVEDKAEQSSSIDLWQRLRWLVWSAIPSALLCAVTLHITTDVASFPLIWVLPLAIYLLTFMLVFADKPIGRSFFYQIHLPVVMVILLLIDCQFNWIFAVIVNLLAFFVVSMSCHGKLVEHKPANIHLSEFYLWLAFGGVVGGWFSTLIAPIVFSSVIEYPILLIASLMVMSSRCTWKLSFQAKTFWMIISAVILLTFSWMLLSLFRDYDSLDKDIALKITIIPLIIGLFFLYRLFKSQPLSYAIGLALIFFFFPDFSGKDSLLFQDRNFFGVSKVEYIKDGNFNNYTHGTTRHGLQSQELDKKLIVSSYYVNTLEEVYKTLPANLKSQPYAVLGLGAGTVACLGKEQRVDFFEIDPMVVKIAENPKYFTYLSDCPTTHKIFLGDGRLELAKQPEASYGLLVMDAFTSDAIPMHLLTREALAVYRKVLKSGGRIAFNVSNRHLNLIPELGALAADAGWVAASKLYEPTSEEPLVMASQWVVLANKKEDINSLLDADNGWELISGEHPISVWTDQHSSIWHILVY